LTVWSRAGVGLLFSELFTEYDQLDVDAVLVSYSTNSSGNETVEAKARGFAATNTYWIILAVPANAAVGVESGVIDPHGNWAVEGPGDSKPAIAVTDPHREEVI
jgi:BarA-like signal transduction histidine kinase